MICEGCRGLGYDNYMCWKQPPGTKTPKWMNELEAAKYMYFPWHYNCYDIALKCHEMDINYRQYFDWAKRERKIKGMRKAFGPFRFLLTPIIKLMRINDKEKFGNAAIY
jgi:hypothetical protein